MLLISGIAALAVMLIIAVVVIIVRVNKDDDDTTDAVRSEISENETAATDASTDVATTDETTTDEITTDETTADETATDETSTEPADDDSEQISAESAADESPEGIHRDTLYASVITLSKSDGYGRDTNAKVKYYLTRDDFLNETGGDYAYMDLPEDSAYVGNNYVFEDASIKEYSDMNYPVITYDGIERIKDTEALRSEAEDEKTEQAADNNDYYVVKAPDGYVNMRTGPGTEFQIITPVNNGEYLQSLGERKPAANGKMWVKVAWWADGHVEGWVIGSQVELVSN